MAKKIIYSLLVLSCSAWSCSSPKQEHAATGNNSFTPAGSSRGVRDSVAVINAALPFGCAILKTFHYPKYWESTGGDGSEFKAQDELELKSLNDCFQSINHSKPIQAPLVKKTEYIHITKTEFRNLGVDTASQTSIDSCRFRLPDFGLYECYYSFTYGPKRGFESFGKLLFYNPATKEAKLLTVYFSGSGPGAQTVEHRYFCINKDQSINIFEGYGDDAGQDLRETCTISVLKNGRIEIKEN